MFKKFLAALGTLTLAGGMALAIAPAASATDSNHPDYWETYPGETCTDVGYSTENSASNPYTLPAAPAGRTYSKVVVKAGKTGHGISDENKVYTSGLNAGATFVHPEKDSISHVIVCTVPTPTSEEPKYTAAAAVSTTSATCKAAEQLVLGTPVHATWGPVTYNGNAYSVTATAEVGYRFPAGDYVAADGKTKTITGTLAPKKAEAECSIQLDTDPRASSCLAFDKNSPYNTFIMVGLEEHVIYTIADSDPATADIVATSKYTNLPVGTYTVTAKAEDGWVLKPEAEKSWTYKVADQGKCDFDPPVLGLATPKLTITQPTCTTDGSYTLGEVEAQPLLWTVGSKTGVANGTYPAPAEGGTITFVAANADPTGGIDTGAWTNPQSRTFQPKPSAAACADLPTLAFTGAGGGLTLGLGAALLLAAGAVFVVIRRRHAAQ